MDVRLSVSDGSIFLKLFVPPLFDGAYLAFNGEGRPSGVVTAEGASLLERCCATPVRALVCDEVGTIVPSALDRVIELIEAGFLSPSSKSSMAHWIRPDKADKTRHIGQSGERFIRAFYDYFGNVFLDGSQLIDSHGDFLQAVARYFPMQAGKVCIDLGCGSGHYTAALARLGHKVYAADISQARTNAAAAKPCSPGEIVPLLTNIEDIALPDSSLDFAMCNFVLEHVADPFAVIDEILRLLRPGGAMVLAVPSLNVRDTIAYWFYGETPSLNFEHLRSYGLVPGTHPWCAVTADTLSYLTQGGADVVTVEGVSILDGLWSPWLEEFAAIAARLGPAFATTWPWSALGRQTVIFARRRQ
ncbi:methyltransferase domain-containing protein [Bradyrhizobium diazoefficiens]|uniref:class I SAM-dependent methyltransferase n=1 Tax=Bradyrhizobium diazoefficiens TaxID=1355477 RepID=UPI00190DFB25|nr:class I SAM-dependent methyltransferase [Bradyrhizobium diazoefficiens]QQO34259.1 methyltransferase domain-containing protein [Bradyrhizobium diazoefficiens]